MTLSVPRKLYCLGAIILVSLVVSSRHGVGTVSFLGGIVIAGLAYVFTVRELFLASRISRRVVFACLALAFVWRIPFLLAPPESDDDIHRYLWDGRIQHLGLNPYIVIPSDPAFSALHTPETRGLNNPEVPSPYPAGAQLFFRIVTSIHESIFAFKIAFGLCDIAIVLLLLEILRRTGQAEHWVLVYAWHPIVATNVINNGHIDILGVLFLLVSTAALARHWRMLAAITFALAVAVKFLPIVLLPLFWRRLRVRDAFVAALVFGALYVPYWQPGHIPTGSLGTYVQRFRFNDPIFATLERAITPQLAAALALCVGLAVAAWLRRKPLSFSSDNWAWPMAASLACAPVIYPWYLLWLLPFVRSAATLPLIVWTVSILPTYLVWHLRSLGREWKVPGWVLLFEYGSVVLAAAFVALRKNSQSATQALPEESLLTGISPDDESTHRAE